MRVWANLNLRPAILTFLLCFDKKLSIQRQRVRCLYFNNFSLQNTCVKPVDLHSVITVRSLFLSFAWKHSAKFGTCNFDFPKLKNSICFYFLFGCNTLIYSIWWQMIFFSCSITCHFATSYPIPLWILQTSLVLPHVVQN